MRAIAMGYDPVDGKLLISQSGGLLVGRRGWNPRPTAWSEGLGRVDAAGD